VIKTNPASWLRSEGRETNGYCPRGCLDADGNPIPERAKHFFNDCPRWDEDKKKLFENVKNLIKMNEREARTDLLPCWFLRRAARQPRTSSDPKHIAELEKFDPAAGILAFCPIDLPGALEDIGVTGGGGARGKIAGQIMALVNNFVFDTYRTAYPDPATITTTPSSLGDNSN